MEKSIVLTSELTNLVNQEIARYHKTNPNEKASDRFLRELILKWLQVSGKLLIKSVSGKKIVSAPDVLGGVPANLCDDTIDFTALNLDGLLGEILGYAVDAFKKRNLVDGASKQLQVAMVLAFQLKNNEVERYSVGDEIRFKTTDEYEQAVWATAGLAKRA
ncbi:MAG: hypothetical protein KF835_06170 [Xanthobacteraceae bacterium]|nr:hypothetical protein [Xanthobacteraceae bacterium]MBX3519590.1 hypothetical protein [Xanthobacteraceae bacterium]MBX3549260.1 hypothetical protein [Xanthobacteraceae bacterium]